MQLWCKKWFLLLAGMILLAHNLTPHHHHEVTRVNVKSQHRESKPLGATAHHHDDDQDEDESDGFALHHSIDHSFVPQHFFEFHMASPFVLALPSGLSFAIETPVLPYCRITPLPTSESPPAIFTIRQLNYRGPPSC
jgi:hypothetical protein